MSRPVEIRDLIERFMDRVLPEPNSGCWLWMGAVDRFGYGQFLDVESRKKWRAHRWILENTTGIPLGKLQSCHKCDVRCCVNPDHLFRGTQADNNRDMARKGRVYRGGPKTSPNRNKTYCYRGHEFTPENTRRVSGRRVCRACARLRSASYRKPARPKRKRSGKQNYGYVTSDRSKPVLAAMPGSGVADLHGWERWELCKLKTTKLLLSDDPWLADAARQMLEMRRFMGWSR